VNDATVRRYGPNEERLVTQPGDFILTHRRAFPSMMIAIGQRIRFRGERRPYAHWTHAALVVDDAGTLVEALAPGLVVDNIDRYAGVEYHYVMTDLDDRDRERVRRYGVTMAHRHTRYDYLEIVSLGLQLLTGATVAFTTGNRMICSGFVATALERTDAIFPRAASTMLPADLAEHYGVQPGDGNDPLRNPSFEYFDGESPPLTWCGKPGPPGPPPPGPASPPVPPAHRVYS